MVRKHTSIIAWLYTGCALVFLMVIVGGITRLTGSGLSITEWKVVTGTLPPLTESAWNIEFEKYKASPQFVKMNAHFLLHDFKKIYWWEYIHRLIARLMGFAFFLPFIYFVYKRKIPGHLVPKLIIIILLGAWQGFLGWYMVKSGLVNNPHVSHLRLAMHLINAFITFAYIYWVVLGLQYAHDSLTSRRPKRKATQITLLLLGVSLLQLTYGAFVAGLRAGAAYNTWPLMDGQLIADSVFMAFANDGLTSVIYNIATVQFIHRTLALVLLIGVVIFWVQRHHPLLELKAEQKKGINVCMLLLVLQVLLGIATLLMKVPIYMGVAHQAVAFIFFGSLIFLLHRLRYA